MEPDLLIKYRQYCHYCGQIIVESLHADYHDACWDDAKLESCVEGDRHAEMEPGHRCFLCMWLKPKQ